MADETAGFYFNVEKFFGSMAVQRMSFAEKGVYLVMLFQQWREKSRNLPDDPAAIADLIAVTPDQIADVQAAWDTVRRKFVISNHSPDRIYNIELENTRRKQRQNFRKKQMAGHVAGKASAQKRQKTRELDLNDRSTVVQRSSTDKTRLDKTRLDQSRSEETAALTAVPPTLTPPDARSKKPIYQSDRFAVFEWQLDDLSRTLGPHADDFDFHAFFDALSQQSRNSGLIIPSDREKRWLWIQAQVEAEARKRGLPFATVDTAPQNKRIAGAVAGGQAFLNRRQW